MNKNKVIELRSQIQAHLDQLSELGVKLKLGNATYSDTDCTFKLEATDLKADGTVKCKYSQAFMKHHALYDLKKDWLGETFISKGKPYKLVGICTRSRKYPIIVENGGNQFKMSEDGVRRCFLQTFKVPN